MPPLNDQIRVSKHSYPSWVTPDYQDLYDANPYRHVRAVGGLFGIGKKQKQQELDVKAAEYDANLRQQLYSEDYNSPEEQVQRLRQAGVNPDLAGGVTAGESAGAPLDQSGFSNPDPIEQGATIIDGFLNIASVAAGLQAQGFGQGLEVLSMAHEYAKQYPDAYTDIAPKGSGLAPVLVRSALDGAKLSEYIPGLSSQQRKKFAKSFDTARQSLGTKVASAASRRELAHALTDPSVVFPEQSKRIVGVSLQLEEIDLKHKLQAKLRIDEISGKLAEQDKELELKKRETASMQEQALQDSAAAVSAEAKLRQGVSDATDPQKIGEARNSAAVTQQVEDITRQEEAKAAEEQLRVIKEAEEEGLFDGTLVTDILKFKIGNNTGQRWNDLWDDFHKRRNAKRNEKRKYGRSSGSGSRFKTPFGDFETN